MPDNAALQAESDPLAYLARLQREAVRGFHPDLRVWVDDASSAAKVLREFAAVIPPGSTPVPDGAAPVAATKES